MTDSEDELIDLMASCGITTGADEDLIILYDASGALTVFAAGYDVEGYFLDADGLEAPLETVELFLAAACPPGQDITICAHAPRGANEILYVRSTARTCPSGICWAEKRELVDLGRGEVRALRRDRDPAMASRREFDPI